MGSAWTMRHEHRLAFGESERRRDVRQDQGRRVVQLATRDQEVPFELANLSARGASGTTAANLREGMGASVTFENGLRVSGVVRSIVGDRVGIEFATPIPLDVVENEMRVDEQTKNRRYRRKSAQYEIALVLDGRRLEATVTDISFGGLRVSTPIALVPGQQVTIEWPDDISPTQQGQVRWTMGNFAGIMFAVPVQPKALAADRMRSTARACSQSARSEQATDHRSFA